MLTEPSSFLCKVSRHLKTTDIQIQKWRRDLQNLENKRRLEIATMAAEETDFINLTAWRKTAELCGEYLKKGQMIGVEGSLQQKQYKIREGENLTAYEVMVENVQFLDGGLGSNDVANDSVVLVAQPKHKDDAGTNIQAMGSPSNQEGNSHLRDPDGDLPF